MENASIKREKLAGLSPLRERDEAGQKGAKGVSKWS